MARGVAAAGVQPAACADDGQADHRRRSLLLSLAAAAAGVAALRPPPATAAEAAFSSSSTSSTPTFTSPTRGYSLLPPPAWAPSSKAGADAFWTGPGRGATLGVVVLPVRLADLAGAGGLGVVGDRLLAAERAKDGTLGVVLTSAAEVSGRPDATAAASASASAFAPSYRYEYVLVTSRAFKTVVTSVAVARGNLFIITGMAPCEGGSKAAAAAVGGEGGLATASCSSPLLLEVRAAVDSFAVAP